MYNGGHYVECKCFIILNWNIICKYQNSETCRSVQVSANKTTASHHLLVETLHRIF